MSRGIGSGSGVSLPENDRALRNTDGGKLIFTDYRNKSGVFLLRENRLLAAAFPENSKIGSVYLARVKDVTKNIDACFVEIGNGEICFLPFREAEHPFLLNRKYDGRLLAGDELPVQVTRDAQKSKQPSVTAHISLSNDYFALSLGSRKTGFSAKLDKEQKKRLAEILTAQGIIDGSRQLKIQEDEKELPALPSTGLVVRTRAAELLESESPQELLQNQFDHLLEEFRCLFRSAAHRTCFSCLRDADNRLSGIFNSFSPGEFSELLTDDQATFDRLKHYAAEHMPEMPVRLYQDHLLPLNRLYSLDSRLETALNERVWLKSGGYLVIQPTEALTVIDVNSGKYEARNKAEEETALKINLEAAEEIALQLKLRNLSGIIVADFINMEEWPHCQELLNRLRELVKKDKVKTTVVDMTSLGLVEITRKKTTKPLWEQLRSK